MASCFTLKKKKIARELSNYLKQKQRTRIKESRFHLPEIFFSRVVSFLVEIN